MANFFSDIFDIADGPLAAAWEVQSASEVEAQIVGSQVQPLEPNGHASVESYNGFTTAGDAFAKVTLANLDGTVGVDDGNNGGVLLCAATPTTRTYYSAIGTLNSGTVISKRIAGTPTVLGTDANNWASGDVLELDFFPAGGVFSVLKNDVWQFDATDPALTAGRIGIKCFAVTDTSQVCLDNFSGGDLVSSVSLQPPAGAVSLAGRQPAQGIVRTPGCGLLSLASSASVLDRAIKPQAGAVLASGNQPPLGVSVVLTLFRGTLTLASSSPVLNSIVIHTLAGSLSVTGRATGTNRPAGLPGSLGLVGNAPIVGVGSSRAIQPAAVVLTGSPPIISRIIPATGSLGISGQLAQPLTGIVVGAGALRIGLQSYAIAANAARISTTGYQALFPTTTRITPTCGDVAFGMDLDKITVATGALLAVGYQPRGGLRNIEAECGVVSFQSSPPSMLVTTPRQPAQGTLVTAGIQPIIGRTIIIPGDTVLSVTGRVPALKYGIGIQPGVGSLSLVGKPGTPSVFLVPSSNSGWIMEHLIGPVNGLNTSFTISYEPNPKTMIVVFTGVPLEVVSSQPEQMQFAYVLEGSTVELGLAPSPGNVPWCRYLKAAA